MFNSAKKDAGAGATRPAKRGTGFSVIGADVVITGDLATAENLQVNGRIAGDVRCGALHQGEGGTITGNITADEARLAGLVDGTVTARLLILEPSARVTGDATYETLCIESGARVDGRFAHREGAGAGTAHRHPGETLAALFPDAAEAAE